MKYILFFFFIYIFPSLPGYGQPSTQLPLPNPRQLAWQEAEFGVIFHYDLHVFDNRKYRQEDNRVRPVEDYNIFNPDTVDTDQWILAAKNAGATFALLTATHETGFALYQSEVNPYCMKALKWKEGQGDIVRDFVNSCIKYEIKPGIYMGIRWNSFFGVHDFKVEGEGEFQRNRQAYYNKMVEEMVKEICTNYGELFEIWFDGGADHPERGAPDVLPIVKKYQPNALFYHNAQLAEARWGGSETGTVPYPCWATFPYPSVDSKTYRNIGENDFDLLKHGDPEGRYWMPAMSDAPLRGFNGRHEWFWEPGDEGHIHPLEDLIQMYYKSVGRNSTLILGLTPDPGGRIPEPDYIRLKEFGEEIQERFARPLFEISGSGDTLNLDLNKITRINHVVLQEEIASGERVRSYGIEAFSEGVWEIITTGSCIGHKKIDVFNEIRTDKIRIIAYEYRDKPIWKSVKLYHVP